MPGISRCPPAKGGPSRFNGILAGATPLRLDSAPAGIVASKGGKVRLLRPDELPADRDPTTDTP